MKGEKVSTPLDKDGKALGPDNMHMVKALPPTSWHQTLFLLGLTYTHYYI